MGSGERISTAYFLVDEGLLRKNLKILKEVQEQAGCRILLAQKAFSMFYAYPLIREYLAGNLCRCSGYEGQMRAVKDFMKYREQKTEESKEARV